MAHSTKTRDGAARPAPFSLEFRGDAILLHRVNAAGAWTELATASPHDPDFAEQIAALRAAAGAKRTPDADIWIPSEQVAKLSLAAPEADEAEAGRRAMSALTSRTSITEAELIMDLVRDGDIWAAAAVERSVVDEALDYVRRWGFEPRRVSMLRGASAFGAGPTFRAAPQRGAPADVRALAAGIVVAAVLGAAAYLAFGGSLGGTAQISTARDGAAVVETAQGAPSVASPVVDAAPAAASEDAPEAIGAEEPRTTDAPTMTAADVVADPPSAPNSAPLPVRTATTPSAPPEEMATLATGEAGANGVASGFADNAASVEAPQLRAAAVIDAPYTPSALHLFEPSETAADAPHEGESGDRLAAVAKLVEDPPRLFAGALARLLTRVGASPEAVADLAAELSISGRVAPNLPGGVADATAPDIITPPDAPAPENTPPEAAPEEAAPGSLLAPRPNLTAKFSTPPRRSGRPTPAITATGLEDSADGQIA
ncbi:MAG: hypothetical protein AAF360_09325, partial [Pseudomonadota bacterium]